MKNLSKLVCVLLLALTGCTPLIDKVKNDPTYLPPGATKIEAINDRWISFSLNDQTFYYGHHDDDNRQAVVIPLSRVIEVKPTNFKCPNCGANIVFTEMGVVH